MKIMNKAGIVFSLTLLLSPLALAGHGGHHGGGHHGYHHGDGWHGHHGGWHGHRGGWHGDYGYRGYRSGYGYRGTWYGHSGGRWVGGVWYGPRAYYGCRNVLVNRRLCSPVCYWNYRYQAERCKTRCTVRPFWVRRCWQ